MQRPITGYGVDAEGDPVATLSCGHQQHVRHRPPMVNRPWVMSEAGRASMLGKSLECVRCDRSELPQEFVAYKRTPVFTEETVPAGLRKEHATKVGVWAKIEVLAGRLRYRVQALDLDVELSPACSGIVVPEVLHAVEPLGQVQFFVEFYRADTHA